MGRGEKSGKWCDGGFVMRERIRNRRKTGRVSVDSCLMLAVGEGVKRPRGARALWARRRSSVVQAAEGALKAVAAGAVAGGDPCSW